MESYETKGRRHFGEAQVLDAPSEIDNESADALRLQVVLSSRSNLSQANAQAARL
jgi:hypothetical protein